MLILLPPSEGKTAGTEAPLDWEQLSLPALNPARERVLDTLVTLCGDDPDRARQVLGLTPGQGCEVTRNAGLRTAPTGAASEIYTGVLYEALDLASLEVGARKLADESVLVGSGLWGMVRLTDRIPAYRCAIGVRLPGLGGLTAYWRKALAAELARVAGDEPVLDLRSAAYGATWRPTGEVAGRTASVRVLHERMVDGTATRSVVSHFNKATKGRLVRDLLAAEVQPSSVGELVTALRDLGYVVEEPAPVAGRPLLLDVIVTEI
ncbi:peroxide stress protein YaaA [Melissospora conviva]|uniref:peroxide stress protein YaaA n=1 Tax=Melissospora conviva TaxID=3388432 RepID=UPI003C187DAF